MSTRPRQGLLLVNLGTPDSPRPSDVRRYLREFLNDPRVIDIAPWKRWLLLNLIILPFRPKESGKAYASIWTDEGSPLLLYGRSLAAKVKARLGGDVPVELGMRYGVPSIAGALDRLKSAGVDEIVVFPLYPQYSSAATGSSIEKTMLEAGKLWNTPYLRFVPPFFDHPLFIDAFAASARSRLEGADPEVVLFSYHGLPERQVIKSDECGGHCLTREDCCATLVEANRNCYRAQCEATTRALGDALGVPHEKRLVCFQSRLGRTPWIKPYTDLELERLAKEGMKRAAIVSPAFVADCLETLEELGMRAVETWREHGGEELVVLPCPNDDDMWADAVVAIARESCPELGSKGSRAEAAGSESGGMAVGGVS